MRYLAPVALFVVTATGCSAGSAFAGPVVCKVWLNAATDEKDPIGKAVVLALKEKLAKSEFFGSSRSRSVAPGSRRRWRST